MSSNYTNLMRKKWIMLILFLSGPALFLCWDGLINDKKLSVFVGATLLIVYLALYFYSWVSLISSKCPWCQSKFFVKAGNRTSWILQKKCLNCGNPK